MLAVVEIASLAWEMVSIVPSRRRRKWCDLLAALIVSSFQQAHPTFLYSHSRHSIPSGLLILAFLKLLRLLIMSYHATIMIWRIGTFPIKQSTLFRGLEVPCVWSPDDKAVMRDWSRSPRLLKWVADDENTSLVHVTHPLHAKGLFGWYEGSVTSGRRKVRFG